MGSNPNNCEKYKENNNKTSIFNVVFPTSFATMINMKKWEFFIHIRHGHRVHSKFWVITVVFN